MILKASLQQLKKSNVYKMFSLGLIFPLSFKRDLCCGNFLLQIIHYALDSVLGQLTFHNGAYCYIL